MTKPSSSDVCASLVNFSVLGWEVIMPTAEVSDFSLHISGVKIQIQLLSGENLHIRDFHRTKVGDVATGISSQVRHKELSTAFCLRSNFFRNAASECLQSSDPDVHPRILTPHLVT